MTNRTIRDAYIGQTIDGRYRVISRIARGGMATVYRAMDQRLDREVALKIMHPHLTEGASGSAFVTRFQREARSAARLSHPNVVAVFDQGATPDVNYLAMELIEGHNLRQWLNANGALTVQMSFDVVEGVLLALVAAEKQGIVHRDIKPENILITPDDAVKVADFGLARAVTEVSSTTTGTILGTVAYVGPELITHGQSDIRTDLYAVGILLYELLTGQQPYTGQTPIQVAFQHVNSSIPAASEVAEWLTPEIDELISTLGARDPESRPQNAAQALEAVSQVALGVPTEIVEKKPHVEVFPEEQLEESPADLAPPVDPGLAASDDGATTVIGTIGGETISMVLPEGDAGTPAPSSPSTAQPTDQLTVRRRATTRDEVRRARMRRRIVLLGVVTLLLASLGVGFWWWWTGSGPGSYTSVPNDVANMQPAALEERLKELNLTATFTDVYDDEIAAGRVITTDPTPGERIRKGENVEILVSLGIKMLTIPEDLPGVEQEEAVNILTDLGFPTPAINSQYHDSIGTGVVISVDPEAGEELPHYSPITLTVSQGPAPVEIPNVTEQQSKTAEELLKGLGLKPVTSGEEHSDTVPQGSVISQDPVGGTAAHRTDTVNIVVSLGPELIEVPDIPMHTRYPEAKKQLEDLGFEVRRETEWGGTFDAVVRQSIAAGEKVPKGTTIVLTVI